LSRWVIATVRQPKYAIDLPSDQGSPCRFIVLDAVEDEVVSAFDGGEPLRRRRSFLRAKGSHAVTQATQPLTEAFDNDAGFDAGRQGEDSEHPPHAGGRIVGAVAHP
jgi:hypothetical protein